MAVRVLRGKSHRHLLFQVWEHTWRGWVMVVECAHCNHREWWSAD
jgi:hypothetical protein